MTAPALSAPPLRKGRGERILAALDVGTSKVASIIAVTDDEAPPRVIGSGVRACHGVKRGLVHDMAKTEDAIRVAMAQAEKSAGTPIDRVVIALSAGGLESSVASVEIDIAGQRISENDLRALLQEGRLRVDETWRDSGRTVLHAEPALYTADGLDGITNPRGLYAKKLAVDIHVLTAATPPCRNLDLAVRNAHLDVETILASGVAASLGVLADEERDLGVALVEIGAGTTTVAVHGGGMLVGLASIPMGAGDITADIARGFSTTMHAAERMKTLQGAAIPAPSDNHEYLDVPPLVDGGQDVRRITRAELISVIATRLNRLFREVEGALSDLGFLGAAGRQVVLTGGGAELRRIAEYAQGALSRNVRIGRPQGLDGLPDAQAGAGYATLAGLVLHASHPRFDLLRLPQRARPQPLAGEARGSSISRLFRQLKRQI